MPSAAIELLQGPNPLAQTSVDRLLRDMDQVLLRDGRIVRVLGSFDSEEFFFGFTLYSPDPAGTRVFNNKSYRKYSSEGSVSETDVLATCKLIPYSEVAKVFEPIKVAKTIHQSFRGTIWHDLYEALVKIVGADSVGILGSALSGLHVDRTGRIINDVDFFVEGIDNLGVVAEHMKTLREDLGFSDYEPSVLDIIERECASSYRNPNNSLRKIISRRWSGMQTQGDNPVRNTIRFRDKSNVMPIAVISPNAVIGKNVRIRGTVSNAVGGNLFPRMFTLNSEAYSRNVYCLWWKISSPVADGDDVEICADEINVDGKIALRITHFDNHFLHIHN